MGTLLIERNRKNCFDSKKDSWGRFGYAIIEIRFDSLAPEGTPYKSKGIEKFASIPKKIRWGRFGYHTLLIEIRFDSLAPKSLRY